MNDHFFLPICFAAAAHGALFFGFAKHPRAAMPLKEKTVLIPFVTREVDEDPPLITPSESPDSPPKSAPDVLPPQRSPEPLVVDSGNRPVMELSPFESVGPKDITRIIGPLGIPDGKEGGTALWDSGILSTGLLDNTPRTRFQAAPIYPFEAKRTGMHGEVHVEFVVDERGHVSDPRVVRSSNRIFDEATLRAVAKWQFEPGRRHGKAVKFRMTVPVIFNVNEGS